MGKIPVTVVVPVKNEEKNLPQCLSLLKDFSEVIVVDSHSTDRTPQIVQEYGCRLIDFTWNGQFPKKRNWVLRNVELKNTWVLFLDADESVTNDFVVCLRRMIENTDCNGFWIYYIDHFMGGQLKHGVKMRKLALFRKDKGEYEYIDEHAWSHLDMEIHEHPIIEGKIGKFPVPLIHNDYQGLEHYIAKHNAYSTWEVHRFFQLTRSEIPLTFRQKVKYFLLDSWILAPLYFIYAYFLRLGILDGRAGLLFSIYKMQYFFIIKSKINELKLYARKSNK